MNTSQLTRVRRMFCNDLTPRHITRHNQREWVRSVRQLGPNWVLNKFELKKEQAQ